MSSKERRYKLSGAVLVSLIVLMLGTLIFQNFQSLTERDTAQSSAATAVQQKKNLAEEVADACQSGQVVLSTAGVDLCDRAAVIAQQPATSEGPAGPRGLPGVAGVDGKDGATGATGTNGADSTVPGAQGPAGASSTVPGQQGQAGKDAVPAKDGTDGAAGSTGAAGTDGKDGRGVTKVECVSEGDGSYWLITYTDGTTDHSSGPCRITQATSTPTP